MLARVPWIAYGSAGSVEAWSGGDGGKKLGTTWGAEEEAEEAQRDPGDWSLLGTDSAKKVQHTPWGALGRPENWRREPGDWGMVLELWRTEADLRNLVESLILAQDQRWRRA